VFRWLSEWFINKLTQDKPPSSHSPLSDFDRILYEIRLCDVILVEGRNRVSEVIKTITQSSWSHAALYIGRLHDIENPQLRNLVSLTFHGPPDTPLVIESLLGKGTVVNPITSYAKDSVRICRPKGLSRQDAQHIITYAINKLGNQYDVRQILDLGRFLLPWTFIPKKLRSSLFSEHAGQSIRTVCSSMIAEAFESVHFPVLPLMKKSSVESIELIHRNTKLYTPKDFDYSPYFDIIKFPFLEIAEKPAYHSLPWNTSGLRSNDSAGISSISQSTDFEMDSLKKQSEPKKRKLLPSLTQLRNPFKKHPKNSTPPPAEQDPRS
jgi:permuted papain-like amidase YaeF/Yiix C92 family enzyme